MRKKYNVRITEVYELEIETTADNEEAAKSEAMYRWNNNKICTEFKSVEVEVIED